MNVDGLLSRYYLPFAKSVIIERAIPRIDGFVPSGRRLLYASRTVKGCKRKSKKIVGDTMGNYHPHGDQSIYKTLVRMVDKNGTLNVPWFTGKGNFGAVYASTDYLHYAADRYTEVGLAPIAEELLGDLALNAVEFVPNFDNTTTEPEVLPVRFPSILVNNIEGIAVGVSCSLPAFNLKRVCDATIAMLKGEIRDSNQLIDALGHMEFPTGCTINTSQDELYRLGRTGKGTFTLTATSDIKKDRIVIKEIPYSAKIDVILDDIREAVRNGDLKDVKGAIDTIGVEGFGMEILLKSNADPNKVLNRLYKITDLRKKVSFDIKIIDDDKCISVGIKELLEHWIKFRIGCVTRIYQTKYDKVQGDLHIMLAWEKVYSDIRDVAILISTNSEEEAKRQLVEQYGLDDSQAEYFLNLKIKQITTDRADKAIASIGPLRKEVEEYREIIENYDKKCEVIINDLERIRDTYGNDNRTNISDKINEADEEDVPEVLDAEVMVVLTKNGMLKRLISLRDMANFKAPEGDAEVRRWTVQNTGHLLVFTTDGTVHKIFVDSIDSSRGKLRDSIFTKVDGLDKDSLMWIDAAGDYSGSFNIIYSNGKCKKVLYSNAQGGRNKYVGLFPSVESGEKVFITQANRFFIISKKRKAALCELYEHKQAIKVRTLVKACRVPKDDAIAFLQPIEKVPDITSVDLDRYRKEYMVSIKDDILW